jgi:outer membrane protein assembly factor BamB
MLSLNTVVLTTPLFLYSLDASSGAVRWQLERTQGGNGNLNMLALAVAPATGAIYTSLGGAGDCISSLDGATGAVQWTYGCYVGPWQDTAGTAVASASGSLFFVTAQFSVLVALSASGGLLWNRTLSTSNNPDLLLSPPALSPDGATLYLGTYNSYEANSLLALDAATGATLWTFRCARGVSNAPLVSGAGVAFVGTDGILYSLSSAGQKLWAARLSDLVCYSNYGGSTPVAAPNGTLFAMSSSGDLFSFDGATGSRTALAVFGASCVSAPVASPVVAGEGLFLGSLDARLYKYAL